MTAWASQIEVIAGGALDASEITMRNGNIECRSGGTLAMRRSLLEQSYFDSACKLVLSASRLEPAPGALSTTLSGELAADRE
jgi:hypothetical protein